MSADFADTIADVRWVHDSGPHAREKVVSKSADLRIAGVVLTLLDAQNRVVSQPGFLRDLGQLALAPLKFGDHSL